jgi:hypothetical protein
MDKRIYPLGYAVVGSPALCPKCGRHMTPLVYAGTGEGFHLFELGLYRICIECMLIKSMAH